MFTFIRLVIWALPLVGLLKARETPFGHQPFSPDGVAEDLRRISGWMHDHAATLPIEAAAPLRSIARTVEEAHVELGAWNDSFGRRRASRLRRLFGFR